MFPDVYIIHLADIYIYIIPRHETSTIHKVPEVDYRATMSTDEDMTNLNESPAHGK